MRFLAEPDGGACGTISPKKGTYTPGGIGWPGLHNRSSYALRGISPSPLRVFQFLRPRYFVFEIRSKHPDSSLEPGYTRLLDL